MRHTQIREVEPLTQARRWVENQLSCAPPRDDWLEICRYEGRRRALIDLERRLDSTPANRQTNASREHLGALIVWCEAAAADARAAAGSGRSDVDPGEGAAGSLLLEACDYLRSL